ncbi:MAG: PAS domain S-box protein [Verrucomicrobiales bacterium]|nr:PAS domain S-box protein [Verrucomicrobiales bacterium]
MVAPYPANATSGPSAARARSRRFLVFLAVLWTLAWGLAWLALEGITPSTDPAPGPSAPSATSTFDGRVLAASLDPAPLSPTRLKTAARTGLTALWFLGLAGLWRGIVDLRRQGATATAALEARAAAEQRFRDIFEGSQVGMALATLDTRIVEINPAFCHLVGHPREVLLGRALAELVHPDHRAAEIARLERLLAGHTAGCQTECRYLHPHDPEVWGGLSLTLLRDPAGQPQFLAAQVQNITEHRRAESQLREQAALLEIAQDAICVQDLDGRIEFWNPAAERLYGWTRAEAIGAHVDERLFARVSQELLQARADLLRDGSWHGELTQAAKDGRTLTALCRFSLVRDPAGKPRSILILSTDLTERKQLEEQFLRAQRMECVGALASGLAHDLNNVFAPILIATDVLADRLPDSSGTSLVRMIRDSATRGSSIVRQLLAFGRGAGPSLVELPLGHLLRDMQRWGRETFPRNIQFTTHHDRDLWSVIGDPTQIHQLLLNLCLNARDAMPQGGPLTLEARNFQADEVFCRMNPDATPGPYVRFDITDAGAGIPEELRERIFDPGFTTKPPGQGTGLGLPTVRTILKSHRGFLELHSRVGEGTRFRVYLPALARETPPPTSYPAPTPPPGQGELVLIVDDEQALCEATRHYLAQCGYSLLTARDGVEAITRFLQHQARLRLVLTDMVMPGLDGAPFIRALRRIRPDIPIIAMSGIPGQRQAAEEAGGPGLRFLEKPFAGEELLRVLQDILTPPPASPTL